MSKDPRKHLDNNKKKANGIRMPRFGAASSDSSPPAGATKKQSEKERDQCPREPPITLESMMLDAERRQNQFEQQQNATLNEEDSATSELPNGHEKSRKTFYREFKKVIDASDIIIEVLDARDPLGCRCSQVEETVLTSGKNKKLILLLNKIDLIPRDNLDQWLKYLRNEYPTIAFRASTQTQRDRLGHMNVSLENCDEQMLRSSKKCLGAVTLMKLLSNYCRNNAIKTSVTVGVVGYPNVGKSSVINSLKRSQACETGATPGLTKQMQTVKLDKLIKLFDSPGIVMSRDTDPANLVLRNCIRIETVDNPLPAIEVLLQRCSKEQMMTQYNLNDFRDAQEFLSNLATKMGCLRKGGVPDIQKAAQKVLLDWNHGRLTYFTVPPERSNDILSTELVSQMREAFDIGGLLNDDEGEEEWDDVDEDHRTQPEAHRRTETQEKQSELSTTDLADTFKSTVRLSSEDA